MDDDPINKVSILMYTDDMATGSVSQAYMTGDSVSHLIASQMRAKTKKSVGGDDELPHFPIYKIQHHGSDRNTQLQESSCSVSIKVLRETASPDHP